MFRLGFHTAFVEAGFLIMELDDLDDVKKNIHNFSPDFQVLCFFFFVVVVVLNFFLIFVLFSWFGL